MDPPLGEMYDDIDLNRIELLGENIYGTEIDLDDAELILNDIYMDGNQQDNHDRTTTVPGIFVPPRDL
ncbi:hypothetical protein L6452_06178 [Arctium lappa]|uniref:Uncharacterized protein n=1 Tax=Arctium lappa TaxID=4217 RepID=A0ACB9EIR7_ARCLA|nr:hypothetical protein L6452_06178 [Arctium lappa]